MRKLLVTLFLIGVFTSESASALNNRELAENIKRAQPTQSNLAYQTVLTERFVLSDNSEVAHQRVVNAALRELGSDNAKNISIVWTDKVSAECIRNELIKKGVKKNKINLVRNNQRDIYPAYVEVSQIGAKPVRCRVDTAEDMMSFDSYNPCATKSNYRIQLKN